MSEILTSLFFEKFFNKSEPLQKNFTWKTTAKDNNLIRKSIALNISNILNTISYLPAEDFLQKKLTVMEFGIPDLTHFTSANDINIDMVSKCIIHALTYYEKRVADVKVEIEENENKKNIVLMGRIKGMETNEIFAYHEKLKK